MRAGGVPKWHSDTNGRKRREQRSDEALLGFHMESPFGERTLHFNTQTGLVFLYFSFWYLCCLLFNCIDWASAG